MDGAIGAPRIGRWPSGDSRMIAMLAREPQELAGRYGISFHTGVTDGRGPCEGAGIRLASGRHLLLTRYAHPPEPGTLVEADRADDPGQARRELLAALGLDEHPFSGPTTRPRARPRRSRPWTNFDADEP